MTRPTTTSWTTARTPAVSTCRPCPRPAHRSTATVSASTRTTATAAAAWDPPASAGREHDQRHPAQDEAVDRERREGAGLEPAGQPPDGDQGRDEGGDAAGEHRPTY